MDVWIPFVVGMAVVPELAAAARDFSASPMASPGVTTTSGVEGQDAMIQWLQITAVPLGVALMGACVWGCIENSVAWRSLTGQRVHMASSATDEGVDLRPAYELSNIDSRRDGYSDMEEGNALSYRGVADNGPANSANALVSVQQPAIESPDDAGSDAATHIAP